MPIFLNTILEAEGINPSDVRLLRHKDNRAAKGRTPYELWRDDRPKFELYQSTQSLANASKLRSSVWASFVGTFTDETLFVGLYQVGASRLLEPFHERSDMAADGVGTGL